MHKDVVRKSGCDLTVQHYVAGDILGRALQNLDGLLQMPYGCGEQNMALLAPNIYILKYLQDTKQLTPAIKEKATNFLTSGESAFSVVEKDSQVQQVRPWRVQLVQHHLFNQRSMVQVSDWVDRLFSKLPFGINEVMD